MIPSKTNPIQLAERMLACHILREIGPEKIRKGNQDYANLFLITVAEEEITKEEIDWEFVLFNATNFQIDNLLNQFEKKKKEGIIIKEDKPNIIF